MRIGSNGRQAGQSSTSVEAVLAGLVVSLVVLALLFLVEGTLEGPGDDAVASSNAAGRLILRPLDRALLGADTSGVVESSTCSLSMMEMTYVTVQHRRSLLAPEQSGELTRSLERSKSS